MRIKHQERIKLVQKVRQAETELVMAWKDYNQARKLVQKFNTHESYTQLAKANQNWSMKNEQYDQIKIQLNQYKNPIYYGKLNPLEETN